jgi:hypothetical protein
MPFGLLSGELIGVPEVLQNPNFNEQHIAVHGLLYVGRESLQGEFLCLPKAGPFNGIDTGIVKIEDRSKVLLISDPALKSKFASLPQACGDFIYRYDAIVVGRVRREPRLQYSVVLTDLWMIVLQHLFPLPHGPDSTSFHVMNFLNDSVPANKWTGLVHQTNIPFLRSEP